MSIKREPVQIVEVDIDYCSLSYGTSPCAALLGTTGVRKCYNTFATCQDKDNFNSGVLTLRFIEPRSSIPVGLFYFPVLKRVSATTSTVNLAGSDEKLGGLGRRATVTVTFQDFPYDDTYTDKYSLERVSGSAQTDEGGYKPQDRGTFFTKLKARFPFYGSRPLRVIDAYIEDGAIVDQKVRHFVMTGLEGPNRDGSVTIDAKDILALAEDKKALCPRPSRGKIVEAIPSDGSITTFTLDPENIGDAEYPASGYGVLGSEIVRFTRVGDTVTLTHRAQDGSVLSSHSERTTFQLAYKVTNRRPDDLIEDLLVNYGNVPSSFIPKVSKWAPDVTKWASSLRLDTVITKPTGVTTLISELSPIGISLWWDEIEQEIGMKINSPVDEEEIFDLTDDNSILDIEQEDRDDQRLTQVHFYTVQIDPTKGATDKQNFNRVSVSIDAEAEQQNSYREPRVKEIFCRWLNRGADSIVGIASIRLLKRFNTAPIHYQITIDAKDRDINLVDVVRLTSRIITDETGKQVSKLSQVIKKVESKSGHEINLTVQAFSYEGKYAKVMVNSAPVYSLASAAEKANGGYLVDGTTLVFSDGEPPYLLV